MNRQARLTKQVGQFIKRHDLVVALLLTIAAISTGLFFGWYNNKIIPAYPLPHFHYTQEPHNPLSFISNWDGPDYLFIAQHGYTSTTLANFFPVYPLLIYLVHFIIDSRLISALLISWMAFVGAIYFYIKLIRHFFEPLETNEVIRATMFFVLFPTGVFLIATYTESLFALLALSAIYCALKKRYIAAALLTSLAGATHVTGIFLMVLIILILIEEKVRLWRVAIAAIVGSLGLLGYMYYLFAHFHKPLAFITSQEQVHGWLKHGYLNILQTADVFNVIFIVLLLFAIYYWWKRRKSFAIYSFLFLLIPLIGKQFGGFNRYMLMAFPVQLMLYAYLKDKKLGYPLALVLMGVVWAYFTLQYAAGYIGG